MKNLQFIFILAIIISFKSQLLSQAVEASPAVPAAPVETISATVPDVTTPPAAQTGDTKFYMGILLDQITSIGSLKACPSRLDPTKYYYLPNKVKIAVDEKTGKPKFSFVKYVTNHRSDTEDKDIKEGEGGGYVQFLMGLSINDDEIRKAEMELQRKVPGAKLIGPVIYREGTCSLIAKGAGTAGQLKVLGVGPAPILDGDFLAIGFELNAQDATILWETMRSPNPQISLNFSMTLAGLNSPSGAKVKVNWDVLKKHSLLNLDIAMPVVSAQISDMVTSLRQNGAIKIETVGNNALAARLIAKIEEKITAICFDETGLADVGRDANYKIAESADTKRTAELTRNDTQRGEARTDRDAKKAESEATVGASKTADEVVKSGEDDKNKATITTAEALVESTKADLTKLDGELTALKNSLSSAPNKADSTAIEANISTKSAELETAKDAYQQAKKQLPEIKTTNNGEILDRDKNVATTKKAEANISKEELNTAKDKVKSLEGTTLADFAVKIVYHRAKVSRSGTFDLEVNSYDPVTIVETFGGNIGKINCRECLLEVNTASHLYTQRELIAKLDGEAAKNDNFGKFVNNVTVRMRKKHGAGDITYDELRIDRKTFNKEGNFFKLMYGWRQGDNNRTKWLDYDYQTTWSFFGGYTLAEEWKPTNNQIINLSPPFNRTEISIQGAKDLLIEAKVRSVFAKIYYKMGNTEYVKKATINPKNEISEQIVEIIQPINQTEFEYEIDWLMNDGTVKKSGRKTSSIETIIVDILPN